MFLPQCLQVQHWHASSRRYSPRPWYLHWGWSQLHRPHPKHSLVRSVSSCALQKILDIARQVEVKYCGMHNLIAHQTTKSLLSNNTDSVGSVEGLNTATATSDAAASSAASTISSTSTYGLSSLDKNDLRQNMEPMSMPWHSSICFGYYGNHRWSKGHSTELVCPFQNHPGV